MNKNMQTFLIIIGCVLIGGGSLALGALTAPQAPKAQPQVAQQSKPSRNPKKPESNPLEKELPTITAVLTAAYPKSATDYTMSKPKLYEEGRWFGALLSYKGTDSMNRDTLRVLMEKKDGEWKLRTTPPEPILTSHKYKDVPVSVLKDLNKPVSLPGVE